MHIKQIIIQGFKSYRDQTIFEPFDKRHNVVVGRNDSGKSNFFYAIQFLLSDEFSHLQHAQHQALLHEGVGPRVLSAYVEIIFDNSGGRIPIEHTEIILRRVMGNKEDQYFLNKKIVYRKEIMDLLESLGFSNSNPYYIIKQGQINQMATASDEHRLKLLHEVAGTCVYDERLNESLAILRNAAGTAEKIEELLFTIEERLYTLEMEKEKLKQYQQYDKIRHTIEYVMHEAKLNETKKKLAKLEKMRNKSGSDNEKYAADLKKAQNLIKVLECETKKTKKELAALKEEHDFRNKDIRNLIKEKAKLDFTIKDLTEEVQGDNKSKKRAENELAQLTQSIKEKEAELEKVKPQHEGVKKRAEQCTRELALKEQKCKELYAKQERGKQFTSKDERNCWIQNELKSLNKQLKDKKEHKERLTTDLKRDTAKQVELIKKIEEQTQEMERQRVCIDEYNKLYYKLKKNKDQHQITQNELRHKENNLQQNFSTLKEDLAKADQALRLMVGKPILNGCDSVHKVLDTFISRGGPDAEVVKWYYGPVIQIFNCDKSIYTAVELIAGNRLFYHVVDNDEVATEILKEMNRQKLAGEVNFLPLNRLTVRDIDNPEDSDVIPMVSTLGYDEKYDKVMRYLFGKTLICRNLDVAAKWAQTTGLDCVTLDGDLVSSKGTLTGGYYDTSKSQLKMQNTRSELLEQIKQCEEEFKILKDELYKIESTFNSTISEMQKTETKNSKAKGIFDEVKGELQFMKEKLASFEHFHASKETSLVQCQLNLDAMLITKESLESELHQELMAQLSVADQAEVDSLNNDIQRLQCENKETFNMCIKLEAEKSKLDNLLTNNLMRRRDEILHALQEISLKDSKHQLANSQTELEEVDRKIEKVNQELTIVDGKVKDMSKKLKSEQVDLEKWKKIEKEAQGKIDKHANRLEKFATKQNLLEEKIAELVEMIYQLGALSANELYSQFAKCSSRTLFKELEKTNNQLKKYSHVNKKALEQFKNFFNQRNSLQKYKEALDKGDKKIKGLLAILQQRKMEAIQFTFKQVSKYFTEVFKKLVPSGEANLVMKTAYSKGINSDNFTGITGIGVWVSFTESEVEMKKMNQLSEEQKSLVALCLIFAIQKCDPAPFYLFDEIDQALDAQHRKTVANVIHELSVEAQIITTTSRPELLEHANKFYGVTIRNKVSHVECVNQEVAKDFLEDDQIRG